MSLLRNRAHVRMLNVISGAVLTATSLVGLLVPASFAATGESDGKPAAVEAAAAPARPAHDDKTNAAGKAHAAPAVFSALTLEQAKERAKAEKKMLLVDLTAEWCPPCKRMDATTWTDPKVEEWVKNNAIAVQLDVDKQAEVVKPLKVAAMPTIVVMRPEDGYNEFDRQLGYRKSEELIAWLEGVKIGDKSVDTARKKVAQLEGKGGTEEIEARLNLVAELGDVNDFAGAADQMVWLWKNIPTIDPDRASYRVSFMAASMEKIAAASPEAKAKFRALRDEVGEANLADWIVLNEVTRDTSKTLAWYESAKKDPVKMAQAKKARIFLAPLFEEERRWSDLGLLYDDPIKEIRDIHELSQAIGRAYPGKAGEVFAIKAGMLYAGMLASGRAADAQKVRAEAIKLADSPSLRKAMDLFAKMAVKPGVGNTGGAGGSTAGKTAGGLKRVSGAASKPGTKPATKPANAPATKRATKPATTLPRNR